MAIVIQEGTRFVTKQQDYCEILKIMSHNEIYVMVSCDEDFNVSCCLKVKRDNIHRRSLKNPLRKTVLNKGYFGVGKYSKNIDGKQSIIYKRWLNMLERCYGNKNINIRYNDCEVCEEWLNFQNYALWYEQNYYEVGNEQMHIEKDFIVKGNKIYCPERCVFAPITINSVITKNNARRGDNAIGVSREKATGNYCVRVQDGHGNSHWIGTFKTEEEAFKHYKYYKELYIKQVAEEYKQYIPEILYNAMINYIVEYDD